jgi:hypothetical protein
MAKGEQYQKRSKGYYLIVLPEHYCSTPILFILFPIPLMFYKKVSNRQGKDNASYPYQGNA